MLNGKAVDGAGMSAEPLTPAMTKQAMPNGSTPPDVYRAICEVATGISRDGIAKGRRNEQQGYGFRGIDDVMNALSALLANADLLILPRMSERTQEERTTAKGSILFYVTVRADFDLVSSRDGSRHTVTMYGEGMDSADKATNKAMSAAYKYCCLQVFCVPTQGMPDADATTPALAYQPPAPKPPAPAAAPVPPPNTQAAAAAVAQEKIRTGDASTKRPWSNRGEMKACFAQVREVLGETDYLKMLAEYGVTTDLNWKSSSQAIECYRRLELLAEKAVA